MAEYIKREAAIMVACKGCNKEFPNEPCEPAECHIQQGLFNIPAADVIPVVRCKDCKHYDGERCEHDRHAHQEFAVWAYDDDFCSYGERREDNA